MERRKQLRRRAFATQTDVSIQLGKERFTAKLLDASEDGFGVDTARPLEIGCRIRLTGDVAQGTSLKKIDVECVVRRCVPASPGRYNCGLLIDRSSPHPAFSSSEPDYYEVLQLSPHADPDTVHRVFRVLAQRFHPDNAETGDESTFKTLVKAYEILRDPSRRAAYDAQRPAQMQQRWRLFNSPESAKGMEAERRKRKGILSLLYARRASEPREPGITPIELEQLLGCPREHLEFALWFLKDSAYVTRSDSGRFAITAKGVEQAELTGGPQVGDHRLIEAAPASRV